MRRRYLVVAGAFALLGGCQDALAPEAEWVAGSWRWLRTDYADGITQAPGLPNARVLTLRPDGEATVSEYDVVVQRTEFRARVVKSAAGVPLELVFDESVVFGERRHVLDRFPRDSLTLLTDTCGGCGHNAAWLFERVQ